MNMGVYHCDKHGMQPLKSVCFHIDEELKKGNFLNDYLFNELMSISICETCYNKSKPMSSDFNKFSDADLEYVNDVNSHKIEKKLDEILKIFEPIKIWCRECFYEKELEYAKKINKVPSFQSFEKTLMYKDSDVILKLTNYLKSNYNFHEYDLSDIGITISSLYIRSGGISYPLTISIKGIKNLEEQNFIISLIDAFFEKEPFYQREIVFYEQFEKVVHENSYTYDKGKVLIKKQYF